MISWNTSSSPKLGPPGVDLLRVLGPIAPTSTSVIRNVGQHLSSFGDLRFLLDLVRQLWSAHSGNPKLAPCFRDAFEFVGALPLGVPRPQVWTDGVCEVVFEWIGRRDHAVVSVEGDGVLGYTMRSAGQFIPGAHEQSPPSKVPADLREYLSYFE